MFRRRRDSGSITAGQQQCLKTTLFVLQRRKSNGGPRAVAIGVCARKFLRVRLRHFGSAVFPRRKSPKRSALQLTFWRVAKAVKDQGGASVPRSSSAGLSESADADHGCHGLPTGQPQITGIQNPMPQKIAHRDGSADGVKILRRIQGVRRKTSITLPRWYRPPLRRPARYHT